MSIGTLFSFCAGILIGLKIYYRHREQSEKRAERQRIYDLFKSMNERINNRKKMQEIIDQQKYGVIYLKKDERVVPLKDGKYILVKDYSMKDQHLWRDLWYGSR